MRRLLLTSVTVLVGLAACSDAPSKQSVAVAAARVPAAPVPERSSQAFEPPDTLSATPVNANAWRMELCSDGSCPLVMRPFVPVQYPTLDEACAAIDAYVTSVGGVAPSDCPPDFASRATGSSGAEEYRQDTGVVVVPGGPFGDTVMYDLTYTVDTNDAWLPGTKVELRLMIGEQFCSDSAIAQACIAA